MGNRVVIQFVNGGDVSPAIYGHWFGSRTAATLVALREQMEDRPGDIAYVSARCVGAMIGPDISSTGFGMWNAPARLTEEQSHGDAGVFIVDISARRWRVTILGGRTGEIGTLPKASKTIAFLRGAS